MKRDVSFRNNVYLIYQFYFINKLEKIWAYEQKVMDVTKSFYYKV